MDDQTITIPALGDVGFICDDDILRVGVVIKRSESFAGVRLAVLHRNGEISRGPAEDFVPKTKINVVIKDEIQVTEKLAKSVQEG